MAVNTADEATPFWNCRLLDFIGKEHCAHCTFQRGYNQHNSLGPAIGEEKRINFLYSTAFYTFL